MTSPPQQIHARVVIPARLKVVILCALLGAGLVSPATAQYEVELNTPGLTGQSAALAFDLVNGDSQGGNNFVEATRFSTDGTLTDLSKVSVAESAFFNEVVRDLTLGSFVKFDLNLSQNHAPPGLDEFSLFVLDPSHTAPLISTSDPTGADALLTVDIDGTSGGKLTLFSPTTPGVSLTVESIAPVADGGGIELAILALLSLAAFRKMLRRAREEAT
jgi:hypothetical protein